MSCSNPVQIQRSIVTRITVTVETNRDTYAVHHGPDDLNIPAESFPLEFERTSGDEDNDPMSAGDFRGKRSVFARANAYIEKNTDKTVPSHHNTAPTTDGVSLLHVWVQVETDDENTYRLLLSGTAPLHDDPAHEWPLLMAERKTGDGNVAVEDVHTDVVRTAQQTARESVYR